MFGFGNNVPEISVVELKRLINSGEKITLVDVRTEHEVARGKIKGSINIPVDKIAQIRNAIKDTKKPLYVYCLSGSRSAIATAALIRLGYKNSVSVTSGLLAWRAKGFPLSTD